MQIRFVWLFRELGAGGAGDAPDWSLKRFDAASEANAVGAASHERVIRWENLSHKEYCESDLANFTKIPFVSWHIFCLRSVW